MRSYHLAALLPLTLLSACERGGSPQVLVEAADYTPIGEALKFIALAVLGCVVLGCITSMINRGK